MKHAYKWKIMALALLLGPFGFWGAESFAQFGANDDDDTIRSSVFQKQVSFQEDELSIETQKGEVFHFNIELALSPAQQAQGLMNRTVMAEDSGMLFIFNAVSKHAFWMKDTLIPLDMLFLSADGTIHHIHHNARPQDLTSITAKFPSKAILELKGGTADRLGIDEGDKVLHDVFRNVGIK